MQYHGNPLICELLYIKCFRATKIHFIGRCLYPNYDQKYDDSQSACSSKGICKTMVIAQGTQYCFAECRALENMVNFQLTAFAVYPNKHISYVIYI